MTPDLSRERGDATALHDPLDLHIHHLGVSGRPWSKVSAQATLLVLTGIALGPQGLAVLTPNILDLLQPAVPVALAVLGVTVAFGPLDNRSGTPWSVQVYPLSILTAGLIMALRPGPPLEALATLAQAVLIAILLAGAGWFLSSRGASSEERRVFSIATFLLIGGVADYLGVSALMLGWGVATAYRLVRTQELANVHVDATFVQHPVTALLLVTGGALVQFSWLIALAAAAIVAVATVAALAFRRPAAGFTFGVSLAPAAFVVALAMDVLRLNWRLLPFLSVVVIAAAALDAFSNDVSEGQG